MSADEVRSVRVGDVWDRATEVAESQGATMSELVRIAVERFLIAPDRDVVLRMIAGTRFRHPRGQ